MSNLPRLFVSHSSVDAELTRQVCERRFLVREEGIHTGAAIKQ